MGDLTKNLSRSEFACKCGCGFDTVDIETVNILQDCVDHFSSETGRKATIHITGPNRCKKHNDNTKGASTNSQHVYARAADFKIKVDGNYIPPRVVFNYLDKEYGDSIAVGLYSNRVHMDTRTNAGQRWGV